MIHKTTLIFTHERQIQRYLRYELEVTKPTQMEEDLFEGQVLEVLVHHTPKWGPS